MNSSGRSNQVKRVQPYSQKLSICNIVRNPLAVARVKKIGDTNHLLVKSRNKIALMSVLKSDRLEDLNSYLLSGKMYVFELYFSSSCLITFFSRSYPHDSFKFCKVSS